jgi:hypothetical protein
MNELMPYSMEFILNCAELKKAMFKEYDKISGETTPELDGSGNRIINNRPDGKQYIPESYMRTKLTELFPGWSWEMAAPLQFLGAEWIVAQGHLIIIDEHLINFGIVPPYRKFYGTDSVRIQYKKDAPHNNDNIIDIGDNAMSAVSGAFKRAINRLTGIGDDVYRKRIDLDGSGSQEFVIMNNPDNGIVQKQFFDYLKSRNILASKAMTMLNISNWNEINDWREAYAQVKSKL